MVTSNTCLGRNHREHTNKLSCACLGGTKGLTSCLIKQDSPETRAPVSRTDEEPHLQRRTVGLVYGARRRVPQRSPRWPPLLAPQQHLGQPTRHRLPARHTCLAPMPPTATHQHLPKLASSRKGVQPGLKDVSN